MIWITCDGGDDCLCFLISRVAALNWNGEGSFLFTSSSAPFDCNDNSPCDEVDTYFCRYRSFFISLYNDSDSLPCAHSFWGLSFD